MTTKPQKSQKDNGIYGRALTSEMMRELDWNSFRILDFFEGIWRKRNSEVFVSNAHLQERLDLSYGTISRALKKLDELGYIKRAQKNGRRHIIPGGVIIFDQGVITDDQGGDHERSGGVITGDHHKTLKEENPKRVKAPPSDLKSFSDTLQYWIKYRAEKADQLSQMQIVEIENEWKGKPLELFKSAVRYSVSQGYQGIHLPDRDKGKSHSEPLSASKRPKAREWNEPPKASGHLSREDTRKLLEEAGFRKTS